MRADLEIERQREGDLHAAENRISCIGNCVISHRRWISSAFLEMMMRHQQMQRSQSSTLALPPQQQLCLRRGVMAHESSPVQMEGIENALNIRVQDHSQAESETDGNGEASADATDAPSSAPCPPVLAG